VRSDGGGTAGEPGEGEVVSFQSAMTEVSTREVI
jgi:hypothetical protein